MKKATQRKLDELAERITLARRHTLFNGVAWRDGVPNIGGVYVIWNKGNRKAKYVGETCHLNHRFGDLERTVNHTFRVKTAAILKVSSGNDALLSKRMSSHFSASYLPLEFGRKELEEYLRLKWASTVLNKPARRLRLSEQYQNIKALTTAWC